MFADVRRAIGIFGNFGEQAFKLAFANIFQVVALRALRGGFIEIDRNFVALPNFAADFFRQSDAVFDADAFNRDERHDVGRTHARMRAGMLGQVNQLGGFSHATKSCLRNGVRLACNRDYAAIVVGVAFAIQQVHAGYFAHRGDDGVNFGHIATFGKIRDRFDESFHVVKDSSNG